MRSHINFVTSFFHFPACASILEDYSRTQKNNSFLDILFQVAYFFFFYKIDDHQKLFRFIWRWNLKLFKEQRETFPSFINAFLRRFGSKYPSFNSAILPSRVQVENVHLFLSIFTEIRYLKTSSRVSS